MRKRTHVPSASAYCNCIFYSFKLHRPRAFNQLSADKSSVEGPSTTNIQQNIVHNLLIQYVYTVKSIPPQNHSPTPKIPSNSTEYQQATLTTVVFLGMLLSSSIWGILADKYGRRTVLVLSIRHCNSAPKPQTVNKGKKLGCLL